MKNFLLFCIIGSFFLTGCNDNIAHNEKTIQLLTEIKEQHQGLLSQVQENSDTLKKLEAQNQQLKKLVERQQVLLNRRFEPTRSRASSPRRLARMIEAMSRKQSPSKIAEILNQKKIRTPQGKTWTDQDVQEFLEKNDSRKKTKPASPKSQTD